MTGPVFRNATPEDLPTIVRLLADDPLGRTRERIEDPLPPVYAEAFRRIAEDSRNRLVVAELDGRVVGTLQLTFIPGLSNQGAERALIEAVRVEAGLRGQGVGGAMVRWAAEAARERGCAFIELFTHKSREAAQRFYARLGFQPSHLGMRLTFDPPA